jgi:RimJ/RimL family protein N-acetyltransferase
MELVGENINLRPFELSDAEIHLKGEDDEQIKWLSGGKSNLEGVREWIVRNKKYWEENGPIFNFAITDKNNNLIGMIEANSDYKELDGLSKDDANISYGLYPEARGRGYAIEAVSLVLDFLKDKGFKRAVIRVNPENKDSLKVPHRCGFIEGETITTRDNELLTIFIKEV